MSESDTESSCGWTVISNEGSDIELLGPENGQQDPRPLERPPLQDPLERAPQQDPLERPPLQEPLERPLLQDPLERPQDQPTSLTAEQVDGRSEQLNATLRAEDEALSEAGGRTAEKTVCSFSDYCDIVSLGDLREDAVVDEASVREDLYLGTSSSSQYTFTAAETVFPGQQPSSSEEQEGEQEAGGRVPSVLRRLPGQQPSSSEEQEEEAGGRVPSVVRRLPGQQPSSSEEQEEEAGGRVPSVVRRLPGQQPSSSEEQEEEAGGRVPSVVRRLPGQQPSSSEEQEGEEQAGGRVPSVVRRLPGQQPSSSEEQEGEEEEQEQEAGGRVPSVVRRRRRRRDPTSVVTEDESGHSEREEEPGRAETQAPPGGRGGALNRCILLAVVVAIGLGFAHLYGPVQTPERQNTVGGVRDLCPAPPAPSKDVAESLRGGPGAEHGVVPSLVGKMERMKKENQQLRLKQVQMQAQKDTLVKQLRHNADDKTKMESQHRKLAAENRLLKSSLEHGEKSLSTLQEELRNLHSQTADLEERGAGADSVRSENQRLKEHLEEEKRRVHNALSQREALMVEVQTLRTEIDEERSVKDQLMAELEQLSGDSVVTGGDTSPEMEALRSRLMELEEKLGFEQQRSDLWERLYVETKEERAKGDTQSTVQRTKEGVLLGKVKETFNAVKNSTKEFVHHHKERIKKAKEAVKEKLRTFSDSVKSTFRYLKDSASPWVRQPGGPPDRRFHEKEEAEEPWQHKTHKPPQSHQHKPTDDSFQGHHNTRKSGHKVQEDGDRAGRGGAPRGCSEVFECAYQESTSLFNRATEPIRADEFTRLLQSYLQQEVDHFRHWKELESFVHSFFLNGVFIHDRMLFTDFVRGVEVYLEGMHEYGGLDDHMFRDLHDYVYRHFFGDSYSERRGPSGPVAETAEERRGAQRGGAEQERRQQGAVQQGARPRPHRGRKGSSSGKDTDRRGADVKIELGPMPFDPKY